MNLKDRKILARTECLFLWDRITTSGAVNKVPIVHELYDKQLLAFTEYRYNCPLCEEFKNRGCVHCPWPGTGEIRCEDEGSPYRQWQRNPTRANARKVFERIYNDAKLV